MGYMERRIRRIYGKIEGKTPDAIVIQNSSAPYVDQTLFYITGLESGLFEGSTLFAYPDGKVVLYTSRLEEESARRRGSGKFEIEIYDNPADLRRLLLDAGSGLGRIGLNGRALNYRSYTKLRKALPGVIISDVSDAVASARAVKDDEEIERIRGAAESTCKVWETLPPMLENGVSEAEVAANICYGVMREGASLAFDPIVAFGAASAEPHYQGGGGRLRSGDLALFDFGARNRRYCADLSRTVVSGRPSAEQRRMYETVLEASRVGLDAIYEGAVAGEAHRLVSDVIDKRGFGGYFVHSTGHSLGMSVHDGQRIGESSNLVLEEGMVFTVEPGVYLPNFGGVRIEDDVVVRQHGCEILTSTGRDLLEV
jgi:Xaa-Pro dipeptidase